MTQRMSTGMYAYVTSKGGRLRAKYEHTNSCFSEEGASLWARGQASGARMRNRHDISAD